MFPNEQHKRIDRAVNNYLLANSMDLGSFHVKYLFQNVT